jgi:pentatricopeptide repeat protein
MTDKTILIIPISWWYWEDRNYLWAISQWKKGISPLLCWTVGSPDVVSFGSVAAALCRGAKLKEAVQLMKQMTAADLRIDTWYHLVRMWRVLHPFTQDAEEIRIQYDHYYWSSIFCCSFCFFWGGEGCYMFRRFSGYVLGELVKNIGCLKIRTPKTQGFNHCSEETCFVSRYSPETTHAGWGDD